MQAQLIPSSLCEEAAEAFADLLKGRTSANLNDEYFARDWRALWDELVRDGWTVIADQSSDYHFSLLDLTAFAQVWGRYLVPLPFMPTLVARRASGASTASVMAETRLSYGIAEAKTVLVLSGRSADQLLSSNRRIIPMPRLGGSDDWAASAPIQLLPEGTEPADLAAVSEGAILAVAEAVGAASAALDLAVQYAKLREQFGQPIGKFQAVKHRLANMHCSRELATSALAWACFESENASRALQAALNHCLLVVEQAVQVHGGIGFTWEAAPHRYYRHVMTMRRIAVAAIQEVSD
jgi:hypothetical protein